MSADAVFCSCHAQTRTNLMFTAPRSYVCSRAREYDVDPTELLGTRKTAHLVRLRADIAKELRRRGFSLPEIGRALNRHHSTVINLLMLAEG